MFRFDVPRTRVHPLALTIVVFFALNLAQALRAAELVAFAAISLIDALEELAPMYQKASGNTLRFNLGGSNDLARQIEAGAPADLFFSADEAKMDALAKKDRLEPNTRRSVLGNTLVIIVPKGTQAPISNPEQLADRNLVKKIVVANPDAVPAGIYAREYLTKLGIWEKLKQKIIPAENVRACLAAVEGGNVEAGIVYKTDAQISKQVTVVYEVPASEGPRISYPLAVLRSSTHIADATKLADFLCSPEASKVFEKFGFTVLR